MQRTDERRDQQRSDAISRDGERDADSLLSSNPRDDHVSNGEGRLRRALPSVPSLLRPSFSVRSFLVVLALLVVGVVAGGAIPLIGAVGQFLGLFVAAFAIGVVGSRARYLEVGLAGAIAAGAAFVLGTLTSVFAPVAVGILADYGVAIAGVGTGTGLLASLLGHYFGRDLRDGLTREV
ncbi:hypothetical protein [Halobellus captivus]|uniref:hypothetical protein n=1 Tax=Halobellus captivus TaxID=2592614 RepID=UPI0011AA1163|nr:hypothetical protein [Halobellus captivus]